MNYNVDALVASYKAKTGTMPTAEVEPMPERVLMVAILGELRRSK